MSFSGDPTAATLRSRVEQARYYTAKRPVFTTTLADDIFDAASRSYHVDEATRGGLQGHSGEAGDRGQGVAGPGHGSGARQGAG